MQSQFKKIKKEARRKRVRARVSGTAARPRLNVFRSLNYTYAQIIDDVSGRTLVAVSDLELKGKKKATKTEKAKEIGALIAQKALGKGIKSVVFDRAGNKYHGRIKAVTDGAREGGLEF